MDKSKRRIQFFTERAEGWDEYVHHNESKIERILDLVGIKDGDQVLDIGCGNGILAPHLSKRVGGSGSVLAMDVTPKMIEVAKEKHNLGNVKFVCDDIQTTELQPESFEAIVLYSMFPHIDKKEEALARCTGFLKPGGKLSICHSDPRYKIISIHKKKGSPVLGDEFPPMDLIKEYIRSVGLEITYDQDDDEMFVLIACKK
jgi:ubiquinone/menaquinone biosynthesis C-methylase UbiE